MEKQNGIAMLEKMQQNFLNVYTERCSDASLLKSVKKDNFEQSSVTMIDLVLKCILYSHKIFDDDQLVKKAHSFLISYTKGMEKYHKSKANKESKKKSKKEDKQQNEKVKSGTQDLDDILEQLSRPEKRSTINSIGKIQTFNPNNSFNNRNSNKFKMNTSNSNTSNNKRQRTGNSGSSIIHSLRKQEMKEKAMRIDPNRDNPSQSEIFKYFGRKDISHGNQDTFSGRSKEERTSDSKSDSKKEKNSSSSTKKSTLNYDFLLKLSTRTSSESLRQFCEDNKQEMPEFIFERNQNHFICTTSFLTKSFNSGHFPTRNGAKEEILRNIIDYIKVTKRAVN